MMDLTPHLRPSELQQKLQPKSARPLCSKRSGENSGKNFMTQRCPWYCLEFHDQFWLFHGGALPRKETVPTVLGVAQF